MLRRLNIAGAARAIQKSSSIRRVLPQVASIHNGSVKQNVTFDDRERGEETRYIREQEQRYKEEMRAKLEKILASENREQREELHELLNEEPDKEKTLIEKLGLDDWKFALPVGIFVGLPLVVNEIVVLSAETQLLGVFILCLTTAYVQGGGLISKQLEDYRQDVYKKLKTVDESILADVHATIAANKELLTLKDEVKSVHSLVDDLAAMQAAALNNQIEHEYREAMVQKLEALVALEDSVATSVRARMVGHVKSDVANLFKNDRKAKDAALEAAIAVLNGGANAKLGKDVVGEAFGNSLKAYKNDYSKTAPEKDELLVQLQRDMAGITTPIKVEGTGGDIYQSHPLIA